MICLISLTPSHFFLDPVHTTFNLYFSYILECLIFTLRRVYLPVPILLSKKHHQYSSYQLTIAHSTLSTPDLSMLKCCLAWVCPSFAQAVTTSLNPFVQLSCCEIFVSKWDICTTSHSNKAVRSSQKKGQ